MEEQEVLKFSEEVSKKPKKGNLCIDNYADLSNMKQAYSNYCIQILNENLIESLNYKVERKNKNIWQVY